MNLPKNLPVTCFYYLEKIGERSLTFGFLFCKIHRDGKVVDKAAVNVKYYGLAKTRDKDVTELLVLVPGTHAFRQSDAKQRVALENFG